MRASGLAALALVSLQLVGCGAEPPPTGADGMPRSVQLCASCHGLDGQATVAGYPNIGGQDERYLLAQLRAYRSGERENATMAAVLGSLDDRDLVALAAWYASRDPCPDDG